MTLADERNPDMLQSPWALTSYAMVLVPTITFSILLPWSAAFCMHNADSLLTAIISVTKITPYYWGQNRFGNLLPIMTSWITNIDVNFMTQVTLRSLFATATPFVCILIMKPRAPLAMTFGFTLTLLLICLTPSTIHTFWIAGQPYGTSAALLAAAIAVTNLRGQAPLATVIRWIAAFALLLTAMWVNLSLLLFTGPLFVLLALTLRSHQFAGLAALSIVSYAIMDLHAIWVGGDQHLGFTLTLDNLSTARLALLSSCRSAAFVLAVFAGAALCLVALRRRDYSFSMAGIALMTSAVAAIFVIADIEWVKMNLFMPRYFSLPLVIAISTCGVLISEALWTMIPLIREVAAVAGASISILTLAAMTLPLDKACPTYYIPAAPGGESSQRLSRWPEDFDVTLVAGDYWIVWPIVFDIMRQDSRHRAFGLAYRGQAASDAIKSALRNAGSARLICFEATRDGCFTWYARILGTRATGESIVGEAVVDGSIAGQHYQVIPLVNP